MYNINNKMWNKKKNQNWVGGLTFLWGQSPPSCPIFSTNGNTVKWVCLFLQRRVSRPGQWGFTLLYVPHDVPHFKTVYPEVGYKFGVQGRVSAVSRHVRFSVQSKKIFFGVAFHTIPTLTSIILYYGCSFILNANITQKVSPIWVWNEPPPNRVV